MKKLITILSAAALTGILSAGSAVSAAEVILPGQTDPGAAQTPVIVAQQPTTADPSTQPSASTVPSQQDTTVPQDPGTQPQTQTKEQFQTPDGILSMDMPQDTAPWVVAQDPDVWFSVNNGTDRITVQHLANGDPVPAAQIADDRYAQIFQVFYSTGNEIFIVTGCAKDAQKISAIRDAVCSFRVLKYDTLLKKELPKEPEVREVSETQYCVQSSGVNVRAGADTSTDIIGGIHYGEQISITGYVIENGADTGWLRISFSGRNGYVHGSNFSREQPPKKTGKTIDLYAPEGGGVVITVSELEDGRYIDSNGGYYRKDSDTEFRDENDQKWVLPEYFEDNPVGQNFNDYVGAMINEATGETVIIRGLSQGGYIDESTGVIYQQEGGGGDHMYGSDGSVLVFPEIYFGE